MSPTALNISNQLMTFSAKSRMTIIFPRNSNFHWFSLHISLLFLVDSNRAIGQTLWSTLTEENICLSSLDNFSNAAPHSDGAVLTSGEDAGADTITLRIVVLPGVYDPVLPGATAEQFATGEDVEAGSAAVSRRVVLLCKMI